MMLSTTGCCTVMLPALRFVDDVLEVPVVGVPLMPAAPEPETPDPDRPPPKPEEPVVPEEPLAPGPYPGLPGSLHFART